MKLITLQHIIETISGQSLRDFARENLFDVLGMETLDAMFGYTIDTGKGKPTNSEFIALIADRIRLSYRS